MEGYELVDKAMNVGYRMLLGEEITYDWLFDDEEWIMSIDIWGKYYFPKFNEEQNQWYHRMGKDEACYMDDFYFILKETYKKVFEVTKLKRY